jgi:hypothetical protein
VHPSIALAGACVAVVVAAQCDLWRPFEGAFRLMSMCTDGRGQRRQAHCCAGHVRRTDTNDSRALLVCSLLNCTQFAQIESSKAYSLGCCAVICIGEGSRALRAFCVYDFCALFLCVLLHCAAAVRAEKFSASRPVISGLCLCFLGLFVFFGLDC